MDKRSSASGPAQVRKFSKALFGNKDRLEVAAAVARSPGGLVNATDLGEEIGLAQSRVRNQLVALADVGLLVVLPRNGFKLWYERRESPFWGTCIDLYDEWAQ